MIAIGTPYNPVLLLWTNMQYENLVQKSLIFCSFITIQPPVSKNSCKQKCKNLLSLVQL